VRLRRLAGLAPLLLAGCAAGLPRDQVSRDVDPDSLIGLAPGEVTSRLGEPELRRSERPVEVWQYRSDTCVFDLYLDGQGGAPPQVVYYEARHRAEGEVRPSRCLGEIVAQVRRAPAG
jgi:hypothetical protein